MYEQWEEYIPSANHAAYLICSRCALYWPHLQDAKQEARIALWQMSLRYEPDRGVYFWTFAGDRVQGAVWDYLRRVGASARRGQQSRCDLLDLDEAQHVGVIPEDENLLTSGIQRAFDGLSERNQAVLWRHCEGYRAVEIASEFGVSPSRVPQIIAASVRRIRGAVAAQ